MKPSCTKIESGIKNFKTDFTNFNFSSLFFLMHHCEFNYSYIQRAFGKGNRLYITWMDASIASYLLSRSSSVCTHKHTHSHAVCCGCHSQNYCILLIMFECECVKTGKIHIAIAHHKATSSLCMIINDHTRNKKKEKNEKQLEISY